MSGEGWGWMGRGKVSLLRVEGAQVLNLWLESLYNQTLEITNIPEVNTGIISCPFYIFN